MRIAAGILMIGYGARTIYVDLNALRLDEWGFRGFSPGLFVTSVIAAIFFVGIGVLCFKRKYWRVCYASSLFLLFFVFMDMLPTGLLGGYYSIPVQFLLLYLSGMFIWGVLPLLFISLGKRDWREIAD